MGTIMCSSLVYKSSSSFLWHSSADIFSFGCGPIAQPVTPSIQPSIHQPSNTLKFMTPLWAAFIPLVPDASKGRKGVFSQISVRSVVCQSHLWDVLFRQRSTESCLSYLSFLVYLGLKTINPPFCIRLLFEKIPASVYCNPYRRLLPG